MSTSSGAPSPAAIATAVPVRRPGRRGGVSRARPAVRVAGRRQTVPQLPLLQPLRLLRRHRPVLRRRLRYPSGAPARPRRRGVRGAAGSLRASPPPPQRRRVPRARVLHLRRVHRRRGRLPGLRHHGQRRAAEAGGRRVPGPDLPRDHRRVGDRPRRALLVGLVLQAGAEPAVRLLRPPA
uniref:Uncharacterized protein n=1 Tax=Setaria viridis TaxID=4556 RepID=A0A4U6VFL2_SETVI|nr:hypothetical protein SEVIR_3G256401v2 [Setaria viridis]